MCTRAASATGRCSRPTTIACSPALAGLAEAAHAGGAQHRAADQSRRSRVQTRQRAAAARPLRDPHPRERDPARGARSRRDRRDHRRLRGRGGPRARGRVRRGADPRRPRLSRQPVPLPDHQSSPRRLRRHRSRTGPVSRSRSSPPCAPRSAATIPVLVKLGVADFADGGLTIEEGAEVAAMLAAAGVDAIETSTGMKGAIRTRITRPEREAYLLDAGARGEGARRRAGHPRGRPAVAPGDGAPARRGHRSDLALPAADLRARPAQPAAAPTRRPSPPASRAVAAGPRRPARAPPASAASTSAQIPLDRTWQFGYYTKCACIPCGFRTVTAGHPAGTIVSRHAAGVVTRR